MANQLELGDTFPELSLTIVGGDTLVLPNDIVTPYAVVLLYRGHW